MPRRRGRGKPSAAAVEVRPPPAILPDAGDGNTGAKELETMPSASIHESRRRRRGRNKTDKDKSAAAAAHLPLSMPDTPSGGFLSQKLATMQRPQTRENADPSTTAPGNAACIRQHTADRHDAALDTPRQKTTRRNDAPRQPQGSSCARPLPETKHPNLSSNTPNKNSESREGPSMAARGLDVHAKPWEPTERMLMQREYDQDMVREEVGQYLDRYQGVDEHRRAQQIALTLCLTTWDGGAVERRKCRPDRVVTGLIGEDLGGKCGEMDEMCKRKICHSDIYMKL
ncbi:hypothetical protein FA95DRAFT_1569588 [Auriscalpium vulgare]|uniref:Uncharacterized protein n=1 Tax=Auriscalpium vulgare TaxID=40419 RepID=A0ACB8S5W9_9AGAM|nr:hypothetical protein FA95DRAFT_1569588 [Auriscalpium vulgare]